MEGNLIQSLEAAVMSSSRIKILTRSNVKSFCNNLNSISVGKRFDDQYISFLNKYSSKLFKNKFYKGSPEVFVLADWIRKRNILKLIKNEKSVSKFPLGNVIHITPGNVDTIFLYSLFISLLNGNKNIIKISNRESQLIESLVNDIYTTTREEGYQLINDLIHIVKYDNDSEITKELSINCNARVIWGSDQTVNEISSIPLNPRAREYKFSERFSFTVINCDALKKMSEEDFLKEIRLFISDISTFSQQACSSPKKVFWINCNEKVKKKWWELVNQFTQLQEDGNISDQFVDLNLLSANILGKSSFNKVAIFSINKLSKDDFAFIRSNHSGNLICIEQNLNEINEISNLVTEKDQTVSVIGLEPEELITLFSKTTAIDRVVRNGEALNFSHIWDGFNMFEIFSRHIGQK